MMAKRARQAAPWIAVIILLLIPLYAMTAVFAIRSGVFDLGKTTISGDEYKAIWAFLASGFGTVVTVIGLLLTRSHNQRTLAFQQDIENRRLVAQRETENRLALDTVVRGLELLVDADGNYSRKAKVAGALASLVHLNHPVIAMRVLNVAWTDRAVDGTTACWLIGEVLKQDQGEASREASRLLEDNSSKLAHEEKAQFDWPPLIREAWPTNMPAEVRQRILYALCKLVLSRKPDWWGYYIAWAISLADEARAQDPDPYVQDVAANIARTLLTIIPPSGGAFSWGEGVKSTREIHQLVSMHQDTTRLAGKSKSLIDSLKAWVDRGPISWE